MNDIVKSLGIYYFVAWIDHEGEVKNVAYRPDENGYVCIDLQTMKSFHTVDLVFTVRPEIEDSNKD